MVHPLNPPEPHDEHRAFNQQLAAASRQLADATRERDEAIAARRTVDIERDDALRERDSARAELSRVSGELQDARRQVQSGEWSKAEAERDRDRLQAELDAARRGKLAPCLGCGCAEFECQACGFAVGGTE